MAVDWAVGPPWHLVLKSKKLEAGSLMSLAPCCEFVPAGKKKEEKKPNKQQFIDL